MVGVMNEVGPRQHVGKGGRVARVPVGNALHILGHFGRAVQRLAALDLVDHLTHVHVDLAAVLAGAVEARCAGVSVSREAVEARRQKQQRDRGHAHEERVYANMKQPVRPTAPERRMTGAKPPLPTNEGEIFSQYSMRPGLSAPTAAPYNQSEGRV